MPSPLRISVYNSKELRALIQVSKALPREIAKNVRKQNKAVLQPAWQEAVRGRAETTLEVKVLANTARVAVSDQNVTLQSAGSTKALRGGGSPAVLAAGTEFGSTKHKQFKRRQRKGYVVFQAAADFIPRAASLWVQTTVRTIHEQFEKVS